MKILIVDDEKNIRESILKFLKLENYIVKEASNGEEAQKIFQDNIFDLAIIDLKMPKMNGLELLEWLKNCGRMIPVIMISAFGEIKDAVEAMKLGAKDYIVKPFNPDELLLRIKRIEEEKKLNDKLLDTKNNIESSFIGESQEIKKIKEMIKKISKTDSNVLITGESGTGKEVVARLIHKNSNRKDGPFIPINIGGIQETLLESELFGYEKGAFTGAVSQKKGMFEIANSGTIFLDEIGEMPLQLQVKLLRVLQDKKIKRIGGLNEIPVDFRLISATNKNLLDLIKNQKFREDLYFRLNVVHITLPPLRERKDDIEKLISFFIDKFNTLMNKKIKGLSKDALNLLLTYNYPGNIRELENIIERAFIFCDNDIIELKDFDINLDNSKIVKDKSNDNLSIKELEKEAIINSLKKWNGNRTKSSKELGISRRTLINKIKEYGLNY